VGLEAICIGMELVLVLVILLSFKERQIAESFAIILVEMTSIWLGMDLVWILVLIL